MWRMIMQFLRTTLVGGLLFLAPLALIAFLVGRALAVARDLTGGMGRIVPDFVATGPAADKIIAAIALLLVTLLAGLFARTRPGQMIVSWVQRSILSTLPQFRFAQTMLASLDQEQPDDQAKVVLVREEGWLLGFVFQPTEGPIVPVFVPDAPNWTAGKVSFMHRRDIRPTNLTMRQAISLIMKLGADAAILLPELTAAIAEKSEASPGPAQAWTGP